MNKHSSAPPNMSTNEVDIIDLIRILWRQKLLILSITFAFVVAASLYAQFSKSIYVARIDLQAPSPGELAALNYSGLKQFQPDEVYSLLNHELQSDKVRVDFYNDIYVPATSKSQSTEYTSAAELSKHISVTEATPGRLTVAIQAYTSAELPTYLEGFLQEVSHSTKRRILNSLAFETKAAIQRCDYEINASREIAKAKRLDLITRLQDALRIAESLDIEKPSTFVAADHTENLAYLRGTHALKAEIAGLQNRTNDDPYIKKFRESLFQKEFLSSINVQPADFAVFTPEGPIESTGPIKPRNSMIIAIGVVFGALMGVIVALGRCFARKELFPR